MTSKINTTSDSSSSPTSTSSWYPWLICGLAAAFYCYEYLLRIAPSAMIPELMSTFGVSAASIGLLSTYYFLAYTPMQFPVGVLMDKYGPRRILTLAVLCCAIGMGLMGLSSAFQVALAGRFLIGFGSAFAFVGVLKLATLWLPANRFAFIAGLTTTLGMIGAMFGQNILKSMVIVSGWESTIIYFGLIGFMLAPIIWFVVRDTPHESSQTPQEIEKNKLSYGQLYQDILKVFKNHQIWINGLIGGLIILPTTIFAELWGAPFLKLNYGFTEQSAVLATSMIFLGWAVGSPLMGFLSDHFKRRRAPLILGALAGMVVFSIVLYSSNLPDYMVFGLLFLFGVISSVEVIVFAVARESSPASVAGTAIAMTNFLVVCAGPFQWVVGKLLDNLWDGTMVASQPLYTIENYHVALLLCPISMCLAFLLAFTLKETHCQTFLEKIEN